MSDLVPVLSVIPQGSSLGSTLLFMFLVLLMIFKVTKLSFVRLFADDCVVCRNESPPHPHKHTNTPELPNSYKKTSVRWEDVWQIKFK